METNETSGNPFFLAWAQLIKAYKQIKQKTINLFSYLKLSKKKSSVKKSWGIIDAEDKSISLKYLQIKSLGKN